VAFPETSDGAACDQSFDADGAGAAGEIWVGAAGGGGGRTDLACFFAAGDGDGDGDAAGRTAGAAALAAAGGVCIPGAGVPVPGSGVMMLTAGVLAALGNSALVGRPVGMPGISAATGGMAGAGGGAFQAIE
jgi:hypothetical protein